ncbi:lytic transglycosylase domain-containing protein [Achromobacter aegrifaciens]|uniref:lytic transglycosylase domain-containing protein n=1 Tax=Achromobacter aegrifaciens TaxID=1287736 RepID=UPI0027BACB2E|nr:lytic transglycosylase domain-containing protein [Achromobacter aegrifaciens]WLW63622.1 lytic transglycosylase domain-containing protein [Achromobacter aegrifaciens]
MDFPSLARQCAPDVHISTLSAVVRHESAFDPLAIGVNAKPHRSIRPKSKEEAIKAAQDLIAKGIDFDVGYGQINVRNWKWLGVTPESIFDPCVNLASAQRVLVDCYKRAAKLHGSGQNALYATFSCYNTGNLTSGFTNGYVGKVIAGAGLPVPAIAVPPASDLTKKIGDERAAPDKKSSSRQDAFSRPRNDAFVEPRADAFARPESPVFGRRVPAAPPQR